MIKKFNPNMWISASEDGTRWEYRPNREDILKKINEIIDVVNSIDAEPIKHGYWIRENKVYPELPNDSDYYWYCSECRSQDQHNINVEVPFCWHCGAKMDLIK